MWDAYADHQRELKRQEKTIAMADAPLTPYGAAQARAEMYSSSTVRAETAEPPTTVEEEVRSLEHLLSGCIQQLDRLSPVAQPEKLVDVPPAGVIETLRRVRRLATDLEQRTMFLANTIGRL